MEKKTSNFSGQLGFVLAAAGSAVGVGNLWRFPYLAAKDGGGLFLIIYLVLVLTFGFTLLTLSPTPDIFPNPIVYEKKFNAGKQEEVKRRVKHLGNGQIG